MSVTAAFAQAVASSPVAHHASLRALQLKSRFVSESGGSGSNRELASTIVTQSCLPILVCVLPQPSRPGRAVVGALSVVIPHMPLRNPVLSRMSWRRIAGHESPVPDAMEAGAGGSALTQLATASGPAGTVPASSRMGRISSFHFIGNCMPGVVCPVTRCFTCVLCSWGLWGLASSSLASSALTGASEGLPAASSPSPWGHCSPQLTLCWLQHGDTH